MTETQANEAIAELWQAGWETLHPGSTAPPNTALATCVPWCADDEPLDTTQLGPLGSWARIQTRPATDSQLTQGPIAFNEAAGVIIVQLFGPLGQGTTPLSRLADDVRTVLKRKHTGELRTHDAAITKPLSDGTWAMRVVTVEYRYTYSFAQ